MKIKSYVLDLLALISGIALTFAFAPFNLFPLAVIAPAGLLVSWSNATPKRAFWRGWYFGAGLFGSGVYWIYISVHTFGNTPAAVALLITGLLIAILALFPALTGYLLNRFFPFNNFSKLAFAFPAIWVFLEWVRSWIFSGFPWLSLGYSQINSPLKGYAPLLSVYSVSLLALVSSGLLVYALKVFKKTPRKHAILAFIALVIIWFTGFLLSLINWTQPTGKQIKISLIQGNIAQELKWSPEQVKPTLDRYAELTKAHWDSQIIIWPEAAVPLPLHVAQDFLNELAYQAKSHQATLITGIPVQAPDLKNYFNAVIALGSGEGIYFKHRLVPFGEFIPLKDAFGPVFDLLQVPMSDFIPGINAPNPIDVNGIKIATFICYEIAYPEQVLSRDGNVDLILTVSNDAWFGRSIAQAQHLQMAQMRALEMGRPILFASNDGLTAFINAHGKIQSIAPAHETVVLTDEVKTVKGKTPWQSMGLDPLLALMILLIIIAWVHRQDHD